MSARSFAESPPSEVRVRREIWESLVSMLRVYAYAAGLDRGEFTVTPLSDAVCVEHKGCVLCLSFIPADGRAGWRLMDLDCMKGWGNFQILESGKLNIYGQEKELDLAAIDWIEDLAHAARSIEEKAIGSSPAQDQSWWETAKPGAPN